MKRNKPALKWSKSSYVLLSSFLIILFLIGYLWKPLLRDYLSSYQKDLPFWIQIDWLLLFDFFVMSILLMINADLKRDILLAVIALAGGFIIEAWGTNTGLWTYYTNEKPPLWIIPAWPIAILAIQRLANFLTLILRKVPNVIIKFSYWIIFIAFLGFLVLNIAPSLLNPFSLFVIMLCAIFIIITKNKRMALNYFITGSCLGYFLELWGTTRQCWSYLSGGTPPLFAVLAHGFAAFSVWQVYQYSQVIYNRLTKKNVILTE
ncbi:MAG: hypothetical protein MUO40_03105 [Anaerolineaceae bacterium]|nr:hypothetical protein [Anaerolineaceae bacterium]